MNLPEAIAGIPKTQVSSVQEVLAAKEFDPEVLLEVPKDAAEMDHSARSFRTS